MSGNQQTVVDSEVIERQLGVVLDHVQAAREDMPRAIAAAMREVLTDPVTLERAMGIVADVAQKRAAEKTGRALGGLVKALFTRYLLAGCIVLWIAKMAGIEAAVRAWRLITGAT